MFYTGFADHITTQFGVVIVNWPLPRFAAPSAMRTRVELNTLISAWENGNMTRFRKLTREEWEKWRKQQADLVTAGAEVSEAPDAIRAVTFTCHITPSEIASTAESAPATPGASCCSRFIF